MADLREITLDELKAQDEIMQRLYVSNTAKLRAPLAFVDTYGCQQNEADSEKIRGMLYKMGYEFTESEFEASLIVINTCAVRKHAEMRVLGNVGALVHAKKANPELKIALCGCMVQQEHMTVKIKNSYKHVDLVFGTHELYRFPELLEKTLSPHKGRIFEVRPTKGERVEGLPVYRQGSVKAWLSVMYGCNNFCSYCVVPYVRGRERSRKPEKVLDEARELISKGFKDITLLGQNVNSYGHDLDDIMDFPSLIYEINKMPGDFIIRFMTSHPKDAGERLFKTLADCEKAAKHIHLPFQSGNDRVLREMNRGYTKHSYLELIKLARDIIPSISVSSDVIVGFPGETETEFEDTLDVLMKARFDLLFTFLYSPREGTPASKMPDPFTREEKQRRFDRLLELHTKISAEKQSAHVGKIERVLIDGEGRDDENNLTARTSGNRLVLLKGDTSLIGQFKQVKLTGCTTWSLYGEII